MKWAISEGSREEVGAALADDDDAAGPDDDDRRYAVPLLRERTISSAYSQASR